MLRIITGNLNLGLGNNLYLMYPVGEATSLETFVLAITTKSTYHHGNTIMVGLSLVAHDSH